MDPIVTTLGHTALAVGVLWIIQTIGFSATGILACSPPLFVAGAAIAGIGAGLLTWVAVETTRGVGTGEDLSPVIA